jgi:formylglycine-generating enzyme required for sulfatase activity
MCGAAPFPRHPRGPLRRAAILGLALLLGNAGAAAAEPDAPRPAAPAGFTNSVGMRLVAIPAGEFTMGDKEWHYNQPHQVRITKPFHLGATLVTQKQYEAVMGKNPSSHKEGDPAVLPVDTISWNAAREFCAALNDLPEERGAGRTYRLPTEAEWEYCCRAGATTEFHTGTALVCGQANFLFSDHSNTSCSIGQTAVVGSYAPNAFGLHDMHGNVSEWCLDGSAAYSAGAVTDPYVSGDPEEPFVYRGGNWSAYSRSCRSAARGGDLATNSYFLVGFRVVLGPVLP